MPGVESEKFIKEAEAELRRLTRLDSWLSRRLKVQITTEPAAATRWAEIEDELRAMKEKRSFFSSVLYWLNSYARCWPALGIACCFLRTNGWELTSEELDSVLQVFKGHIQQDTENLSNTDSTRVSLTLFWGDDVTCCCGYRNALIFEMLKLWVKTSSKFQKCNIKNKGTVDWAFPWWLKLFWPPNCLESCWQKRICAVWVSCL